MTILTFYFLLLAVVPCCNLDCCKEETTQSKSSSPKAKDACSPFTTCNAVHGFVVPTARICFQKPELQRTELNAPAGIASKDGFSGMAWNPPRTGML